MENNYEVEVEPSVKANSNIFNIIDFTKVDVEEDDRVEFELDEYTFLSYSLKEKLIWLQWFDKENLETIEMQTPKSLSFFFEGKPLRIGNSFIVETDELVKLGNIVKEIEVEYEKNKIKS